MVNEGAGGHRGGTVAVVVVLGKTLYAVLMVDVVVPLVSGDDC